MEVKGTLKAITLELRDELEGKYDAHGNRQPGDLERRLAAIGVRRDRPPVPVDELSHLSADDREARRVVDAFLQSRAEAGQGREAAIAEFVREAAYSWANRLLALRCMEARGLIDEVILRKDAYGGRSLQHQRLARKEPERCSGEDEGLLAVMFDEFARRANELPLLFDPGASEVALRPSVAALKRCIALLSGTLAAKGQEVATDEVFTAPDALGWTYQYWNTEEKDRIFEKVRTKKGAKIEGADIVPATCIYTEPYMVKFLVQNSLGAMWMGMNPGSRLCEGWEYYVRDADRAPAPKKAVSEITFLDPACGSGHFLIEAFDLLYSMYLEEGVITYPAKICATILERNLYGIDIDERAVQIAALALVMKAKERAPEFVPRQVNLVATNIRLPAGTEHLEAFLRKHPEDAALKPALLAIFDGLAHADELGSLLQIEEPVEKELRWLREKHPLLHQETNWEMWKHAVIHRLRQHFGAEAAEADLATAFFGEAATKGLSLVDLLARRYDVVAANPPYIGSRKMGALVKSYLRSKYPEGARDTYAAFLLRTSRLAGASGYFALLTPVQWLFMRDFTELREQLVCASSMELFVHLGHGAFDTTILVFTGLIVCRSVAPQANHKITAIRLIDGAMDQKVSRLRAECSNPGPLMTFVRQSDVTAIPSMPLVYWAGDKFLELLRGKRMLSEVAEVRQGLATGNNSRFTRCFWEVDARPGELSTPQGRWWHYAKGGGYRKWFGLQWLLVDWRHDGWIIRSLTDEQGKKLSRVQNEDKYGVSGLTYTLYSNGSLGCRALDKSIFDVGGMSIFPKSGSTDRFSLAALLNTRVPSYLLRLLAQDIKFQAGTTERLPLPRAIPADLAVLGQWCVDAKRALVASELTEYVFLDDGARFTRQSLVEAYQMATERVEALASVLHTCEGFSEREAFVAYGVDGEELAAVLDETGTPAAWFPLIRGYEAVPGLPISIRVPPNLLSPLGRVDRRELGAGDLAGLMRRLRALYEAGSGGRATDEDAEGLQHNEEEEGSEFGAGGARIPIPAETFIEELAQSLEVHPISVYWLLRELREKDGVVCGPELRRFVEDYVSVTVLRLLGHRWPREVESAEAPPAWADQDGIIPIIEGMRKPSVVARLRERMAEDFGADRVHAIEREFAGIVGKPIDLWLGSDFFNHQISQFKKRPIAWQIESAPGGNGKRQRRRPARKAPAFSCLVYYHRLNADLLPKLRTQYLGPLRTSFQTESGGLEKLKNRTADQDARRLELEEKLDELKAFDTRLEEVISGGFTSTALEALAAKEPLDKWASRCEQGPAPASRETFVAQERQYDPDLNDGVRVNVAPLQRAGLLAADVLAAKDVEKAIADRAEWRADERRWCRERKLPQPGWWSAAGDRR